MSNPKTMMTEIGEIARKVGWKQEDWPRLLVVENSESKRGALSLISVAAETKERVQCFRILAEELFAQPMWTGFSEPEKNNLISDFESAMTQSIGVVGSVETTLNAYERSHLIEAITAFVLRDECSGLEAIEHEVGRLKSLVALGGGDNILNDVTITVFSAFEKLELSRGV